MKILITGGHLTPALALIDELKKEKVEIIFLGRKYAVEGSRNLSAEYQKIKDLKIKLITIVAGRLQRKFTVHTVPSILKIPLGFAQTFFHLLIIRPNIVVSFGGYLSTPAVFAAWLLGIPSLTHEQAAKAGLANKINSIFTKAFYSAWPLSEIDNVKVIGNPMRQSYFTKNAKDPKIEKFISTTKKIIFVTGGSLGSHAINQVVFESVKNLSDFQIIHQLGTVNHKQDHEKAKKIKSTNYLSCTYISSEDFGAILNSAHIVISRAGANTTWELATLSKVAILIPLPISGAKEQYFNAKILESAGSSVILPQSSLTPETLPTTISEVEKSYMVKQKQAQLFAETIPTGSAKKLKDAVMKILNDK